MKMRKTKQKGITLIALVITIIVLLILAGVAISLTIGENGIFNVAKRAALEQKKQTYFEEIRLIVLEEQTERTVTSKTEVFITSLKNKIEQKEWIQAVLMCNDEGDEKENTKENTVLIVETIDGYEIIIDVNNEEKTAEIKEEEYKKTGRKLLVIYDANGGTGNVASQEVRAKFKVMLKENTFIIPNEGYVFSGWCIDKDGNDVIYATGSKSPKIEEDTTFYAIWVEDYVTLQLDANGGTGTMEAINVIRGRNIILPQCTITRIGYIFKGWKNEETQETYEDGEEIKNITNDITLKAQWEAIATPKISITDITETSFKINITNNYKSGILTEVKYYVGGTLKDSGTSNTSYIVQQLNENTEYTNIYVEAFFETHKLTSEITTATTIKTRVNSPIVANTGLTPVTINSSTGALTTVSSTNTNWYHYADTSITGRETTSQWANAKTNDNSLWVWIPRYAYKITYTNSSNKSQGGRIDIVFLSGTTNNDFNGNDVTSTSYVDAKGGVGAYIVHPSFKNGTSNSYANGEWDKEITGYWVAKFEAGYAGTAGNASTATDSTVSLTTIYTWNGSSSANYASNYYGTRAVGNKIKYPVFQGNRPSMNYLGINDAYNLCLGLNATNNPYGFTSIVYPHLTKNSEWGAVAYLTHSKYGRNGQEIRINNVSVNGTSTIYAVTGYAASTANAGVDTSRNLTTLTTTSSVRTGSWTTSQGQLASTTGNIYGIYDLSGGLWEWTAGYIATGDNYNTYGGSLKGNSTKYKSKYAGTSATDTANYSASPNPNRVGEAIWETSTSGTGATSWHGDYTFFYHSTLSVSKRGGGWDHASGAGVFTFARSFAYSPYDVGLRPIVIVE